MNITKDIIPQLQAIDLSTEAAIVKSYEALANSPLLMQFIFRANLNDIKVAYRASKQNPKLVMAVMGDKLRDYATIERTLNKRRTIKAIRRRIGVLFAQWEAEEKAGGLPASDGYLYEYAISKGFNPDGVSLNETDTAALDELAEFIFTTIEKYFLYSLTEERTAVDERFSQKVSTRIHGNSERLCEEAVRQINRLFSDEWANAGDGLTTSCEEEVMFFGAEANSYIMGVIKALATDMEQAAELRKVEKNIASLTPDEEEAASIKQAQESRYKDYINNNTIC